MNKSLALAGILAAGSLFTVAAPEALASTPSVVNMWEVEEHSNNGHALWFNGLKKQNLASSTDFQFDTPGLFTEYSDGTATLTGTIFNKNRAEEMWDVNLTYSLINNYDGGVKLEQVKNAKIYKDGGYDNMTDYALNEYSFYELDTSNSILTGLGAYEGSELQLFNRAPNEKYVGQVGEGANAKNTGMGMSFWYGYTGNVTYETKSGDIKTALYDSNSNKNLTKSDINVNLTQVQSGNTAGTPEPLTILGSLSALGFGAMFKKKHGKKAAKKTDLS